MPKNIPLSQGKVAIVDDEDYDELSRWKWCISSKGYAVRNGSGQRKGQTIHMHREIIGVPPDGMETDHKNQNKIDNRKVNLRHCTRTVNQCNKGKYQNNKSGVTGVSLYGSCKRRQYVAEIHNLGRRFREYFNTFEEAVEARQRMETRRAMELGV